MPDRTKQQIIDDIADTCGILRRTVAAGSTEPKELFVDIVEKLGLRIPTTLSKPELAEAIAIAGGDFWGEEHDSRGTPSGGGSTVSAVGLETVLRAVNRLAGHHAAPALPPNPVGTDYRPADEDPHIQPSDPFQVDPDAVDRANAAHRATQNRVAEWARARGFEVISPLPGDPLFDVGWRAGEGIYIVEVKSLVGASEDNQMRMGLGQVLDYQASVRAASGRTVHVAVVTSRKPTSDRWQPLFAAHGVTVAWPGALDRLAAEE